MARRRLGNSILGMDFEEIFELEVRHHVLYDLQYFQLSNAPKLNETPSQNYRGDFT
jgi:hypothetical protein